jgi:hypothetical protein
MFCRFCGSHLLDDSVFCSKCGKRTGRAENPRLEKAAKVLRLRTPYPYSIMILLLVGIWAMSPHGPRVDYSNLKWTLEADRKLDLPDENLYQQGFSLILENSGTQPVREIPIDLSVRIEPAQPAEIAASFLGTRLPIMERGKASHLLVVLKDEVRPGAKRAYLLEGSIEAKAPFKVTYEVREEHSDTVLANFVVER